MRSESPVIDAHRLVARDTFELVLGGCTAPMAPGQFVQVALAPYFLRRPLSVCDVTGDRLTLVYKVVGAGTRYLAGLGVGATLDVLTGLGRGFDVAAAGPTPLVVGGGLGVAPLYFLVKGLIAAGARPRAVLGFTTAADVFYAERFAALCPTQVTTVDGSQGVAGLVTDALPEPGSYSGWLACGPAPMLRAVAGRCTGPGQVSLEERMGCGFGACLGCSIRTVSGSALVCVDGPVFPRQEVIWA